MARRRASHMQQALTRLLPRKRIPELAARYGVVRRRRKLDVVALVCSLVLGFGTGRRRSLTGLRRAYAQATGVRLASSSFQARFTRPLVVLMRCLAVEALQTLSQARPAMKSTFAPFREVLVADSALLRLHDGLQQRFPSVWTHYMKASAKLGLVVNVLTARRRTARCTGTCGLSARAPPPSLRHQPHRELPLHRGLQPPSRLLAQVRDQRARDHARGAARLGDVRCPVGGGAALSRAQEQLSPRPDAQPQRSRRRSAHLRRVAHAGRQPGAAPRADCALALCQGSRPVRSLERAHRSGRRTLARCHPPACRPRRATQSPRALPTQRGPRPQHQKNSEGPTVFQPARSSASSRPSTTAGPRRP